MATDLNLRVGPKPPTPINPNRVASKPGPRLAFQPQGVNTTHDSVTLSPSAAINPLNELALSFDQIGRELRQLVHGEFRLSVSHGCVHMPSTIVPALLSHGVGRDTKIIIHGYDENPPSQLPAVLEGKGGKNRSSDLRIDIYPGGSIQSPKEGELAALSRYDKKSGKLEPLGHFKVRGGPKEARMASNKKPASPTPMGKFTAMSPEIKRSSGNYENSNIPGGARIALNSRSHKAKYSINEGRTWQEITNKKLLGKLFDKEERKILCKQIDISGMQFIYRGNDFTGAGYFENGVKKPGIVWRLHGRTEFLHGGPSADADYSQAIMMTQKWLLDPKSKLEDIEEGIGREYSGMFWLYVKIGRGEQLNPAESVLISSDPALKNLKGLERDEAIEERSKDAVNDHRLLGFLKSLAPKKAQIQKALQNCGAIKAPSLREQLLPQEGDLDPLVHNRFVNMFLHIVKFGISVEDAVKEVDDVGIIGSSSSYTTSDQEINLPGAVLVLRYDDGKVLTEACLKIGRKEGESDEALYARYKSTFEQSRKNPKLNKQELVLLSKADFLGLFDPNFTETLEIPIYEKA